MGFIIISQIGSQIKFCKVNTEGRIIVIVPKHKEISAGTIKSILRQGMIDYDTFERA